MKASHSSHPKIKFDMQERCEGDEFNPRWIIQQALQHQGKCSREDWLQQLKAFHGLRTSFASKSVSCS